MPRSKRDKKVSLTKTSRKGLEWKQKIVDDIRVCMNKYPNIFMFSVNNMRNNLLKELRHEWKKNSRLIFGKNRIMQLALGKTKSEEHEKDLHKLAKRLHGQCGLLFTERSKKEILKWSKEYEAMEYARSGFVATETVILPEGPLEGFSHAIEPYLRSLGLPIKLEKGVVSLYKEYTVCVEGKALTPEQARILKLVAKPMALFTVEIKCCWLKGKGFKSFVDDDIDIRNPDATDSGNPDADMEDDKNEDDESMSDDD